MGNRIGNARKPDECGRWAVWPARHHRALAAWVAVALMLLIGQSVARRGRVVRLEDLPQEPVEFRLDINRAQWADLMVLPGISEIRARRITEWRRRNGPFRHLEDLQQVHGIGPKLARQIAPWIAFSSRPQPATSPPKSD